MLHSVITVYIGLRVAENVHINATVFIGVGVAYNIVQLLVDTYALVGLPRIYFRSSVDLRDLFQKTYGELKGRGL